MTLACIAITHKLVLTGHCPLSTVLQMIAAAKAQMDQNFHMIKKGDPDYEYDKQQTFVRRFLRSVEPFFCLLCRHILLILL